MRRKTYIHERTAWPEFTWDGAELAPVLSIVHHRQGRLLGKMDAFGFELRSEANLAAMTSEVVKSSAIEGEVLDPREVRSSIARRLGLDGAGLPKAGRDVEGIVEVMLDATGNFEKRLTKKRLYDWHAALFPTGRNGMGRIKVGGWRTARSGPMQVVSGPTGHEKVHFEPPEAGRLESEMARFIAWFNAPAAVSAIHQMFQTECAREVMVEDAVDPPGVGLVVRPDVEKVVTHIAVHVSALPTTAEERRIGDPWIRDSCENPEARRLRSG